MVGSEHQVDAERGCSFSEATRFDWVDRSSEIGHPPDMASTTKYEIRESQIGKWDTFEMTRQRQLGSYDSESDAWDQLRQHEGISSVDDAALGGLAGRVKSTHYRTTCPQCGTPHSVRISRRVGGWFLHCEHPGCSLDQFLRR